MHYQGHAYFSYEKVQIVRELNYVYPGFYGVSEDGVNRDIATGRWVGFGGMICLNLL